MKVADLKKAKEDLRLQVVAVVSGLQREYELAKNNESILSGAVSEAKQTIQGSNQKEFALQGLEREVKTNLELYDMFMAQLKSTRAVSDLQSVVARVVDPALPGSSPIKPKKQMVISLAFVLSLMLGVAVAFLLEHLDNSVRSTEDAERKIGLPLLAAVPKIELAPGKTEGGLTVARSLPAGMLARDEQTGQPCLKIPLPPPETVQEIARLLSTLLGGR